MSALESDRLVSASGSAPEDAIDRAIRPRALADYIGQEHVKSQLSIFIDAARMRAEALDHVLIFGPPGLGKTTLAHVIATELHVNLRQTSGPVLERPGDLAAILTNLQPQATCCSSMRSTASVRSSRRFSIRRWRTISSTS